MRQCRAEAQYFPQSNLRYGAAQPANPIWKSKPIRKLSF